MPRGNGGIIGPVNSSFSGVWSLTEAQLRRSANTWPNFYAALLSESATGSDAVTGADTADPYFEYTTLLLPGNGTNGAQNNTFLDGSTNNFTITRNGNTTQGTFSPFSQTGWGNYFDGSGDYLSVPDNAAFTLGSGDFTVEVWVYKTTTGTVRTISAQAGSSGANTSISYSLQVNASEKVVGSIFSGATNYVATSSGNCPLNAWTHIALARDGNTLRLYINGIQDGTASVTGVTVNDSSDILGIGSLGAYTALYWPGYLSNFRLVKGTCVYPSGTTFTPPTSPLTAISGTSLLTCQSNRFIDNSTNNFTITRNGDTRVVAFSPFNPDASWSAATYGGSGYFDGSGDNLKVSNNAAFQFGTTAFTIEFWVYLTTTSGSPQFICFYQNSSTGYNITLNASAVLTANLTGDGADITGTTTVQANQWNHIALSGTGGTSVKLFLNGVQEGSTFTGATSLSPGTYPFTIGSFAGGGFSDANFLTGYMSDVRVIKGTALYTSNFTPPTAPLTAITNTSLLLNFTNAGVYDATSKNDLETVGNAQISNTTAKWGSTSMSFDGTGDYLLAPSQVYLSLPSTFTVECWAYFNSLASTNGIWFNGTFSSDVNRIQGTALTTGEIRLYIDSSSATVILLDTPAGVVTTGQWYHLAFTVSGGTAKIFVNGTQQASGSTSGTLPVVTTLFVGMARASGAVQYMNGYLQDFRVTRGYARYTANFTPPTAAFPTL